MNAESNLTHDQGSRTIWQLGGAAVGLAALATAALALAGLGLGVASGSRWGLIGGVVLLMLAVGGAAAGVHLFLYRRRICVDPETARVFEEWTVLGLARSRDLALDSFTAVEIRKLSMQPGRASAGGGVSYWLVGLLRPEGNPGFVAVDETPTLDDARRSAGHLASALGLNWSEAP